MKLNAFFALVLATTTATVLGLPQEMTMPGDGNMNMTMGGGSGNTNMTMGGSGTNSTMGGMGGGSNSTMGGGMGGGMGDGGMGGGMGSGNDTYPPAPPRTIGMLLFPGFAVLDVFGPIEFINILSTFHNVTLVLITPNNDLTPLSSLIGSHSMMSNNGSTTMSMMSGGTGESIVPTHTFANTPKLDILIVPGGMGTRTQANNTALTNFIRDRMGEVEYLLTVCTGSALAARSGVLDGKKATGTKFSWKWITQQSDKVQWVPQARWVEDGKILSSSGVTASLDMIYYFMSKLYGEKLARRMTNIIEYMPNTDPTWDPFAEIWGVVNNTAKSGTGNGSSNAAAALANPIGAGGSLGMWIAALAVLAVAVF